MQPSIGYFGLRFSTPSLLASLCACFAAAPSFGGSTAGDANLPQISGFVLPQPMSLQPFKLVDQNGDAFTIDDLRQGWTLVFFGYTHCPDVCPTTLVQLRAVKAAFARLGAAADLSVVFVSIDPQRDGVAQLAHYSRQLGDDFTGVGGSPLDVDAFARQFKVKYAISGGTSTSYFIDHTSSVALITPQAQLRAMFSVPLRAEAVATDIHRIVQADGSQRAQAAPVTGARQ